MSEVTLSPSLAVITDEIGSIRAEIKRLKALDETLTAQLKDAGAGKYAGSIWSATVYEVKGRTSIDWQSIAMHFEPSRQLITAHTTTGEASLSAKLAKI